MSYHIIQIFFLAVARVILTKSAHQNHTDQPNQKYNHHEGIENTEPVNLNENKRKERKKEIFYLTTHSTHFINGYMEWKGNVLFNDALNTFYLVIWCQIYGKGPLR